MSKVNPEKKREQNKRYRERHRGELKAYFKELNQRPERKEKQREYYQAFMSDDEKREAKRARDRANAKRKRRQRRKELIDLYGGKCERCGFDDWRALQIDHVNNNGYEERQDMQPKRYYQKIKQGVGTGEYQLLCANCNQIKRYEED